MAYVSVAVADASKGGHPSLMAGAWKLVAGRQHASGGELPARCPAAADGTAAAYISSQADEMAFSIEDTRAELLEAATAEAAAVVNARFDDLRTELNRATAVEAAAAAAAVLAELRSEIVDSAAAATADGLAGLRKELAKVRSDIVDAAPAKVRSTTSDRFAEVRADLISAAITEATSATAESLAQLRVELLNATSANAECVAGLRVELQKATAATAESLVGLRVDLQKVAASESTRSGLMAEFREQLLEECSCAGRHACAALANTNEKRFCAFEQDIEEVRKTFVEYMQADEDRQLAFAQGLAGLFAASGSPTAAEAATAMAAGRPRSPQPAAGVPPTKRAQRPRRVCSAAGLLLDSQHRDCDREERSSALRSDAERKKALGNQAALHLRVSPLAS